MTAAMPTRRGALVTVATALFLTITPQVRAQHVEEIFTAGNDAFFEGRYPQAVSAYMRLVEAGIEDGDVYYNLASAHARQGQLGYAVLYFERALIASGGDEDAATALRVVRELLGKRVAERRGEATVQTRPPLSEALVEPFAESTLAWGLIVALWLLFGALILRRIGVLPHAGVGLGVAAAIGALLSLILGSALVVRTGALQEGPRAVIVQAGQTLRDGPDPKAKSRAKLSEGGLARLIEQEGTWVRIRTDGGLDGWTPAEAIGVVEAQLTARRGETRIGPP